MTTMMIMMITTTMTTKKEKSKHWLFIHHDGFFFVNFFWWPMSPNGSCNVNFNSRFTSLLIWRRKKIDKKKIYQIFFGFVCLVKVRVEIAKKIYPLFFSWKPHWLWIELNKFFFLHNLFTVVEMDAKFYQYIFNIVLRSKMISSFFHSSSFL